MKNNEASIFVFLASIIVGIMISLNISFSSKGTTEFLDTRQYEEASKARKKLYDDLDLLNIKYNESYYKLTKYENGGTTNSKVIQEMQTELANNKLYIGTEKMHGPGIKIVMDDTPDELKTSYGDANMFLVHNYDIAIVINELKAAGAEAITLNGNRIMDRTGVFCEGSLIKVNDEQIWAPFTIEAIGNPSVLQEYAMRQGGYIDFIQSLRNISVTSETKEDIILQPYSGSLQSKYIK